MRNLNCKHVIAANSRHQVLTPKLKKLPLKLLTTQQNVRGALQSLRQVFPFDVIKLHAFSWRWRLSIGTAFIRRQRQKGLPLDRYIQLYPLWPAETTAACQRPKHLPQITLCYIAHSYWTEYKSLSKGAVTFYETQDQRHHPPGERSAHKSWLLKAYISHIWSPQKEKSHCPKERGTYFYPLQFLSG